MDAALRLLSARLAVRDRDAVQAELRTAEDQARADAWWSWHDEDPARWSPGEDPQEATADADRRCMAWVRGESDDGPEEG